MISENLPRRTGRSANADRARILNGPLEAEAGRQRPGSREAGAGRQEAVDIRMFNHWATGLRSGLLPQVVVLQNQKLTKKRTNVGEVCARVLIFGARG